MVDRISTAGQILQDAAILRNNKARLDQLQFQLATGRKYRELKLYGSDAPRIVDLRRDIDAREAYNRSIDLTEGIASSYDAVLDRLSDVASEVLKAAEPLDPSDPNFTNDALVIAENLMMEVQANLNIRIGDRYIFAGTNFDTAPVVDIRSLTLYSNTDIGLPNADETADNIPTFEVGTTGGPPGTPGTGTDQSYHVLGPNTTDAAAWTSTVTTVNDNQQLSYGITATDPAFQQLVEAMMRLKSSTQTGLTTAERQSFIDEARTMAETARTSLRQLQTTNGAVLKELSQTKELHTNFINISQTTLDEIQGVDSAQVAVEISTLQTQLQASFSTIASRNQLSLVNFLS